MQLGAAGLALIKEFEGCKLEAYQDQHGIWTIGWGHTGPEVVPGLVWTQEQADAQLVADTQTAVTGVMRYLDVTVNQNQFDALVSFAYNVGVADFAGSTLLRLLNGGYPNMAAAQFPMWDHIAGQVNAGLLRRCDAEQALFERPVTDA